MQKVRKNIILIILVFILGICFLINLIDRIFSETIHCEVQSNIYENGDDTNGCQENLKISNDEVPKIIRQRYGEDVALLQEKDGCFTFTKHVTTPVEGDLTFCAELNNGIFTDNYYDEFYRYTGDAYFAQTSRIVEWVKSNATGFETYIPVFYAQGTHDDAIRSLCEDVSNYVEYCRKVKPFDIDAQYMSSLYINFGGEQYRFAPTAIGAYYNRTQLYNELYIFIDELIKETSNQNYKMTTLQEQAEPIAQDVINLYLTYEPDSLFVAEDGMEYRIIAVDRAAGSSYFVLLGTYDGGKTCSFLNRDPFNGSGGTSTWLWFMDEKVGFAGLAYSGGNYGRLYRTEDGGKTFSDIELSSAKIKLSDGTYYNPFIMPEKVYEECGKLYLIVGQGPNGDYYGEKGHSKGLYISEDLGETWKYTGDIPEETN